MDSDIFCGYGTYDRKDTENKLKLSSHKIKKKSTSTCVFPNSSQSAACKIDFQTRSERVLAHNRLALKAIRTQNSIFMS